MTPEQALQLLDQMAAATAASRADHAAAQQAVRVLAALIADKDDEK